MEKPLAPDPQRAQAIADMMTATPSVLPVHSTLGAGCAVHANLVSWWLPSQSTDEGAEMPGHLHTHSSNPASLSVFTVNLLCREDLGAWLKFSCSCRCTSPCRAAA